MKIVFTSNLTIKEHISSLQKRCPPQNKFSYTILSQSFKGYESEEYFFGLTPADSGDEKLKTLLILENIIFKDIINDLLKNPFHKKYTFNISENVLTVDNPYGYLKKYPCTSTQNINLVFPSKVITDFRLNNKTFTKTVTTLLTNKGISFLFDKKDQKLLLLSKLPIKQKYIFN